jgi:hypothetical protein
MEWLIIVNIEAYFTLSKIGFLVGISTIEHYPLLKKKGIVLESIYVVLLCWNKVLILFSICFY